MNLEREKSKQRALDLNENVCSGGGLGVRIVYFTHTQIDRQRKVSENVNLKNEFFSGGRRRRRETRREKNVYDINV